jgi:hypothetical protein
MMKKILFVSASFSLYLYPNLSPQISLSPLKFDAVPFWSSSLGIVGQEIWGFGWPVRPVCCFSGCALILVLFSCVGVWLARWNRLVGGNIQFWVAVRLLVLLLVVVVVVLLLVVVLLGGRGSVGGKIGLQVKAVQQLLLLLLLGHELYVE